MCKIGKGKIYQYDLDGNFIREFKHCVEAQDILKCSSHLYYHLEKGYPKTIQNCVFSYKFYIKYPSNLLPNKLKNQWCKKMVQQFDLKNLFIKEYNSLTEASMFTNIALQNINCCTKGKRKTAGGYIWKYKD